MNLRWLAPTYFLKNLVFSFNEDKNIFYTYQARKYVTMHFFLELIFQITINVLIILAKQFLFYVIKARTKTHF